MTLVARAALAITGLLTALAAQERPSVDLTRLVSELLVPMHTQPADPDGGEYGIWCAGPDYKASFHDGFAFYPHLGPKAPEHLPLRWHTESIAMGETLLPFERPRDSWRGQRFERRSGDVIEAYEGRRDGVEQTFTLLRRPAGVGDLVITGCVDTKLTCPRTEAKPQELVFTAQGKPVNRYGRAIAIDAEGRRCDVATAWDGARIRLVLAGWFLEQAVFPLVVDPLTASAVVHQYPDTITLGEAVIAAETGTAAPKLFIAFERVAAGVDHDLYAVVTSADFATGTGIYQDLSTAWSSAHGDVTYVAGATKWALSFQRDYGASVNVRVYLHDAGNLLANTGTTLLPSAPSGMDQWRQAIGGSTTGNTALLVFERKVRANGLATTWGIRINAAAATTQDPFHFNLGWEQLRWPRVTPMAGDNGGWVVAMVCSPSLRVAKVPNAGSGNLGTVPLVTAGASELLDGLAGLPEYRLAGADGRYLLCHTMASVSGLGTTEELRAVRFDWDASASLPTVLATRTYVSKTWPVLFAISVRPASCEFDLVTRSHWALSYRGNDFSDLSRIGHQGGITETQVLDSLLPADLAFARPSSQGTFPLVYSAPSAGAVAVMGSRFTYPADAVAIAYGTGCGSGLAVTTNRSYVGHEFYRVTVYGLPPGAPATFTLSSASDNVDLTAMGMPGCFRNVALPALATMFVTADSIGRATVTFPLPEVPLFIGDLFSQWSYSDPSLPQPVRFHRGIRHQVR